MVVRDLWRKVLLEATEQALGRANRGKVLSRQKVFKAHAIPQGMCANLIIALKLLAEMVSRTACGTSSGWIMIAARELLKVRKPKNSGREIGKNNQGESG